MLATQKILLNMLLVLTQYLTLAKFKHYANGKGNQSLTR